MNRTQSTQHHDQTPSVQTKFAQHVKTIVTTLKELGNPFTEDSRDLVRLYTKEVMGQSAVTSVQRVKVIGQSQYDVYVAERLEDQTTPVSDIISKKQLDSLPQDFTLQAFEDFASISHSEKRL